LVLLLKEKARNHSINLSGMARHGIMGHGQMMMMVVLSEPLVALPALLGCMRQVIGKGWL
jgi:hypothetical protein